MVSIIIKEWTTKIELVPAVQKRNAAVLLRKPGRLAPQYAFSLHILNNPCPKSASTAGIFCDMVTLQLIQHAIICKK